MRLMPPPLLVLSAESEDLYTRAALLGGDRTKLLYATNKFPVWTDENRIYTVAPDNKIHLGLAELEIDAAGSTIDQIMDWAMEAGGMDRPYIRLKNMSGHGVLNQASIDGAEDWWTDLNTALDRVNNRSMVI